jgi:hypothetical protein
MYRYLTLRCPTYRENSHANHTWRQHSRQTACFKGSEARSSWVRFPSPAPLLDWPQDPVGTRGWGQHVDPVGKCWERASILRRSRVLRRAHVAPAFTRTVTRSTSQNNLCDSHSLCVAAIVIAGGRTRPQAVGDQGPLFGSPKLVRVRICLTNECLSRQLRTQPQTEEYQRAAHGSDP